MLNCLEENKSVGIEAQAEQRQEYKFLGQVRKGPGLILFSYDYETDELKQVKLKKEVAIGIDKKVHSKNKATISKSAICFFSLNLKNAQKKVNKIKQICS